MLVIIAVVITVNVRLGRSNIGRAWVAIREDELAAQAMGVPLVKTKIMAFATGASFAGVMGVIFAAKQQFISPESFSYLQSIGVLNDGDSGRHGQYRGRDPGGHRRDLDQSLGAAGPVGNHPEPAFRASTAISTPPSTTA